MKWEGRNTAKRQLVTIISSREWKSYVYVWEEMYQNWAKYILNFWGASKITGNKRDETDRKKNSNKDGDRERRGDKR